MRCRRSSSYIGTRGYMAPEISEREGCPLSSPLPSPPLLSCPLSSPPDFPLELLELAGERAHLLAPQARSSRANLSQGQAAAAAAAHSLPPHLLPLPVPVPVPVLLSSDCHPTLFADLQQILQLYVRGQGSDQKLHASEQLLWGGGGGGGGRRRAEGKKSMSRREGKEEERRRRGGIVGNIFELQSEVKIILLTILDLPQQPTRAVNMQQQSRSRRGLTGVLVVHILPLSIEPVKEDQSGRQPPQRELTTEGLRRCLWPGHAGGTRPGRGGFRILAACQSAGRCSYKVRPRTAAS
eukprot:765957-Hanusia_phi.AAC.10